MTSMSNEIIEAAIEGMEAKKRQINAQILRLRGMLNGAPVASSAPAARSGRRFSAASVQRMREAQRRRWARVRGEASETTTKTAAKPKKRRLSAQGRKNIIEATKRYWAAKRTAAKKK